MKTLLLTSVEAALVVTVVSVLGMEQLSPSVGIDMSALMQTLGTKPGLVLRKPVWQQVVLLPRELLSPLQRRVWDWLVRALFQVLVSVWQLLSEFNPRGGSQWPLPFNWGLATKLEACGS